jgi:diaminopimelate epimerase
MCGNGIRCFMKYIVEKGLTNNLKIDVETWVWVLNLEIENNIITVDMWKPSKIKNLVYKNKNLWDRFPLKIDNDEFIFTPVSMWNPHAVIFCKDSNVLCELLDKLDIWNYWRKIENHVDIFPDKTNVEFVKIISDSELLMRVWERWTWETLACWTWACAAVVAWILLWRIVKNKFVEVKLPGWIVEVKWSWKLDESVIMRWDANIVFEWYYNL